jgi:hypothetical protein
LRIGVAELMTGPKGFPGTKRAFHPRTRLCDGFAANMFKHDVCTRLSELRDQRSHDLRIPRVARDLDAGSKMLIGSHRSAASVNAGIPNGFGFTGARGRMFAQTCSDISWTDAVETPLGCLGKLS